jgi:MoaA/NifB/PqqE/SkfB family radical SAM enzyme
MIVHEDGVAIYDKKSGMTLRLDEEEARAMIEGPLPSEKCHCPEVVHIELTSRCNLDCPYCYVRRDDRDLSCEQWAAIIKQLADAGVFQITFGGGEPLMRKDAPRLAKLADDSGLNVTITTNGTSLNDIDIADLKVFRQINISYHDSSERTGFSIEEALGRLHEAGIPTGIHIIMRKDYLPQIPRLAALAKRYGSVLLLLSYKPVDGKVDETVPIEQIIATAAELLKSGHQVALDNLTTGQCFQKERLCVISSSGEVYPCSFVRQSLGNVARTGFLEIWRSRGAKIACPYRDGHYNNP